MMTKLTPTIFWVTVLTAFFSMSALTLAQVDNRQTVTAEVERGDSLRVRRGPGIEFQELTGIPRLRAVPVLGYDATGRWAKVLWDGHEGWAAARFLSGGIGGEKLNPNSQQQGHVTIPGLGPHVVAGVPADDPIGGLALRSGPGTDFDILQVLENDVDVFIIQRHREGTWAFVRFRNGHGYVSTAFLKTTDWKDQTGQTGNAGNESGHNVVVDNVRAPGVFRVTDVAYDDVLNIRREPNAQAEIFAHYPPNQLVEVIVFFDNGWARVNYGADTGFVNGKFLSDAAN
jgi:uncharacterized protein YraI